MQQTTSALLEPYLTTAQPLESDELRLQEEGFAADTHRYLNALDNYAAQNGLDADPMIRQLRRNLRREHRATVDEIRSMLRSIRLLLIKVLEREGIAVGEQSLTTLAREYRISIVEDLLKTLEANDSLNAMEIGALVDSHQRHQAQMKTTSLALSAAQPKNQQTGDIPEKDSPDLLKAAAQKKAADALKKEAAALAKLSPALQCRRTSPVPPIETTWRVSAAAKQSLLRRIWRWFSTNEGYASYSPAQRRAPAE